MDRPLHERTLARVLQEKAARNGDRPILLFEGRSFSYSEAYGLSSRIAGGLWAAGIRPRQHVAVMMENRPETVWLNFALALIGAVAVPVNNASRGELLAYYVAQSDSVAIIIDETFVERFALVYEQCPLLERVVLFSDDAEQTTADGIFGDIPVVPWIAVAAADSLKEPVNPEYSDILHIIYSSGSTGRAKGNLVPNATAVMAAVSYVELNGYDSNDVMYTCLPLFHGNAWYCSILPALVAGGTAALSRRFSASNFWQEIVMSGATHCSLLGSMTNFLLLQPPSSDERNHRLRVCLTVPTPDAPTNFERRYNVRIASLYSLSDFALATVLAPHDPRDKLKSAGRPRPQVSVAILDEDDLPLPSGEIGEICLRNNEAWVSRQGYYKKPELFLKATRNLWFHTGDRGWIDEDGYLYFAGRNSELIRRRGENISALDVERVILKHPAVANTAVFAVRSEFLEDEVMASVQCKSGHELDFVDLIEFCAARMAYFMVPRFLEVIPELPITPTEKVEKYKLREAAEKRISEIWDREKSGIVLEK
jgi:crotonobetaine/carnitine-CoA ligase